MSLLDRSEAWWLARCDNEPDIPIGAGVPDMSDLDNVPLTFGQKAVGLSFNPSGDSRVEECKQAFADIIDALHALRSTSPSPEVIRLASTAITQAQGAQMWAVKAITWVDG